MAIGVIWDDIWDESIWNNLIWSQQASVDATPDDNVFTSQSDIVPSASVDSNTLTLTGMSTTATASIDVGTMSVGGDSFSATSRVVSANGTIQARQSASASENTTTTVNITISGVVFEFSVTTGYLAATLSAASVIPSASSATVQMTTNKPAGTWYWVVTDSATQPSIAQIKAGQDHTGSAAESSGINPITATGVQVANASGLTPETSGYYTHNVVSTTGDSNRLSSGSFTTLAAGLGNNGPFSTFSSNLFGTSF